MNKSPLWLIRYGISILNKMSGFTGDTFIDEDILLQLDIADLLSICQSSEYLNSICLDDTFWKRKLKRDFPSELLQYKPDNVSYRDQYEYLYNSDIRKSVEDCRLDGILYNSQSMNIIDVEGILKLCSDNVVNTLLDIGIIKFTPIIANYVAGYGRLDILDRFIANNIYPIVDGANMAALNGQLITLEFLISEGIFPNTFGANWAASNGHIGTVG